jgi:hypothetical protein
MQVLVVAGQQELQELVRARKDAMRSEKPPDITQGHND